MPGERRQRISNTFETQPKRIQKTDIDWHCILLGKPQQNGFIGNLRGECLHEMLFGPEGEGRKTLEDYN